MDPRPQMGLVNKAVPKETIRVRIRELVGDLPEKRPAVLKAAKRPSR
jgi:hypothetical protein